MMNTIASSSSTFQEWSAFVQVLNQSKHSEQSLLKKTVHTPEKLIHHLDQEFKKQVFVPSFFLKYKYGKQLTLAM